MYAERCVRMWRLDQPQASHHPTEQCCHTAMWLRVPPTISRRPRERPDTPSDLCGAAPHVIGTFMERINCTCLQENMERTYEHTHEYMHGNRTDFLVGSTWNLPTRVGLTHVYPSVLPFASNSILGCETLYSDASVAILEFYHLDSITWLSVSLLVCSVITAIAREVLEVRSDHHGKLKRVTGHLFDAFLLYICEHLQMGPVQFPGYPQLRTLAWLQLTWLTGSFLLFSVASNDLISLLMSPLASTAYKSVAEVAARNASDLIVYYMPQTLIDVWVKTGQITFRNPFRVSSGLHFLKEKNQVLNVEMRHERSIIIADRDVLELEQVDRILEFDFATYITPGETEDNFRYFLTSTTLDPDAERYFRSVYMSGFVESGLLVQDVNWYRWIKLLPVSIKHAAHEASLCRESESCSADFGQHFEPLKLSGFDAFFGFLAVCYAMFCVTFGLFYGWKRHKTRKDAKMRSRHGGHV